MVVSTRVSAIFAGGMVNMSSVRTTMSASMPGAIALAGLCHRVLPLPSLAPCALDLLRPALKRPAIGRIGV